MNTAKLARATALIAISTTAVMAFAEMQQVKATQSREYTITVRNGLAQEKLAPILVVGDADDTKIWVGAYVSPEARTQFTTGNPAPLAQVLGGDQGLPGKLGVGKEVTFKFRTSAKTARITAMVHPDVTPDNYVTASIDLSRLGETPLVRYDIGDDEGRKSVLEVGPAGSVTVK
jgi:hypothetical protein